MAKAADEVSTSPPLRGPHWIGLRKAIERRWQQLGASDPAMGLQAIKAINDELESGVLVSKLIAGDHEELVTPERWRKELNIHVDGKRHWLGDDDEQGVDVPDLATLRVQSRRAPDRQLLAFVWAPPDQGAAEASVESQSAEPPSPPATAKDSLSPAEDETCLEWLGRAVTRYPQRPGEGDAAYHRRLRELSGKAWSLSHVKNSLAKFRRGSSAGD